MNRISQVIFRDNGLDLDQTSAPAKADASYGNRDGRHSLAFYLQNYTGRIKVEASLAAEPTESDWFPIYLHQHYDYADFPVDPADPTGPDGDSGVVAYTFTGNFYWVRVKSIRSHITPAPASVSEFGRIDKVLLST